MASRLFSVLTGLLLLTTGCDMTVTVMCTPTPGSRTPTQRSTVAMLNTPVAKCMGTFISPHVVLTAGHCIVDGSPGEVWSVRTADGEAFPPTTESRVMDWTRDNIRSFKGDSPNKRLHDVALIIVSRPFQGTGFPTLGATPPDTTLVDVVGRDGAVAVTHPGRIQTSGAVKNGWMTYTQVIGCVKPGDSGGGIFNRATGELIAINSFSVHDPDLPRTMVARVDLARDWVMAQVAEVEAR